MAQGAKPKQKKKPRPKLRDKVQSERFIEAARELGIEETGAIFDNNFDNVAKKRKEACP
jgi:hypothetical protein